MELNEANIAAIAEAMKRTFVDDEQSPILVKSRIRRICDDVSRIKDQMWWHQWLLLGIAGGIGLLALKTLGLGV